MTLELPARPSLRHPRTGQLLAPVGILPSGRVVWPILGGDEEGAAPSRRERINELLATEGGIPALTAEQTAELRGLLDAEIAEDDGQDTSDETLAWLTSLADTDAALRAEQSTRDEAAAARAAEVQAVRDRLRAGQAPAEGTPEGEAAPEGAPAAAEGAAAEGQPAAEGAPAAAAEPELVTASAPAPRPIPLRNVRVRRDPERETGEVEDGRVRGELVASVGGRRIRGGDQGIEDLTALLNDAIDEIRAGARRVVVASSAPRLPHQIPDGGDPEVNRRAMDEAVRAQTQRLDGLAASGGICRPVDIDYNIPTWVNVEEPVKAGTPSIDAPRGGLSYALPVAFDSTVYGAGVAFWSEPNDRNPGGSNTGPLSNPTGTGPTVKPCVEIDCDSFVEVDVEAITQCLQLSNFRARFSPENVEKAMGYLQMAFAQKSEIERLQQMRAAAHHVSGAQEFGATRDLLAIPDRIRAYYRSVYRLSDNVTLRVAMQRYVRELIRIDLMRAAFPAEADSGFNSLAISDAQVDALFMARGIVPLWVLDDDTGDQSFAKTTAGSLASPNAFPSFPAGTASNTIRVRMLAYPEGTYQRLDGGELNLGVVRDSGLNAINKFQIFSEVFEAMAFRGFEATDFRIDVLANGATAGSIVPTGAGL